ncbi:hypothetical protein, partial [Cellvibrio sp. QJXJ]|uniref:hypothetical protein n=1 Tax=Cellvibrio sp. QJXJ TaxID=2964606 RepID=UPI0021C26F4A
HSHLLHPFIRVNIGLKPAKCATNRAKVKHMNKWYRYQFNPASTLLAIQQKIALVARRINQRSYPYADNDTKSSIYCYLTA